MTMSQSTGQTHGKAIIGIALWAIKPRGGMAEQNQHVHTNAYNYMYMYM